MTTSERLRIIQQTFSHAGHWDIKREMGELIEELHFVHKDRGKVEAYHRYDGCGLVKNFVNPGHYMIGAREGLRRCSNGDCKCINPDCENPDYCLCY